MGTPAFAVPSLERLISDGHTLVGVLTQPDKPKNRGMKLLPSPIKTAAMAHDIPVYQPDSLKSQDVVQLLSSLVPELIVVAAYGKILPKSILDLPQFGCINVHSSLLPRWRGAAPINWAVIDGDEKTGVTIMHMAEGLDTGDIISQRETLIDLNESVIALHDRLAEMGADLLSETVFALANGTAQRTMQDYTNSCYAPMLGRELSPIKFTDSALKIHNQVRGLLPWPATNVTLNGHDFKVFSTVLTDDYSDQPPGTILGANMNGILVVCGDGRILCIAELQPPGKKRMSAADYLRGHSLF